MRMSTITVLLLVMPGEYKITINDVPVLNVPIKKGHDTKLKCGVLNVVSESYWDLSDIQVRLSTHQTMAQ